MFTCILALFFLLKTFFLVLNRERKEGSCPLERLTKYLFFNELFVLSKNIIKVNRYERLVYMIGYLWARPKIFMVPLGYAVNVLRIKRAKYDFIKLIVKKVVFHWKNVEQFAFVKCVFKKE